MNLYEGQSKVALRPKTTEEVSQARCKTPPRAASGTSRVQLAWASSIHISCSPAALPGSINQFVFGTSWSFLAKLDTNARLGVQP